MDELDLLLTAAGLVLIDKNLWSTAVKQIKRNLNIGCLNSSKRGAE